MLDIKYVMGDDWAGFYINNVLKLEGHSIRFIDGLEEMSKYINTYNCSFNQFNFNCYNIDQDWLEDQGELPCEFEDIPEDMLEEWN